MSSPKPGPSGLNKRLRSPVFNDETTLLLDTGIYSAQSPPSCSLIPSSSQYTAIGLNKPKMENYKQKHKIIPGQIMDDAMKRVFRPIGAPCSSNLPKLDDKMCVPKSVDTQQVIDKNRMVTASEDQKASEYSVTQSVARGYDISKSGNEMDLGNTRGYSVKEWVSRAASKLEIRKRFTRFLLTHTVKDKLVYKKRIEKMCAHYQTSFSIEYAALLGVEPALASFIIDAPKKMLPLLNEVASLVTSEIKPECKWFASEIRVKINNIPVTPETNFISAHLDKLVRFVGVVTTITGTYASLSLVQFECRRCRNATTPCLLNDICGTKDEACGECQDPGPLYIQESPRSHFKWRKPRKHACILFDDLRNSFYPGNKVDVTGIYRNNYDSSTFRDKAVLRFETVVVVHQLFMNDSVELIELSTPDDISKIIYFSKYEHIVEMITNSIMPSMPGYDSVKRVLALALFGGVRVNRDFENVARGDIHVLFYGDPRIAKSQILQYVEESVPRCAYIKGKDAVIGDFTATAQTNPEEHWMLTAGALVLADKGFCLIDGLDETTEELQLDIDESMDDIQKVPVNTCHIIKWLNSRCSVLATTNLANGEYKPQLGLYHNVKLSKKILSRFDILCLVHDEGQTSGAHKTQLAESAHKRRRPHETSSAVPSCSKAGFIFPQELLKKYILYARSKVQPKMEKAVKDRLAKIIEEMTFAAALSRATPVTARRLHQSLTRLTEAHARMHLRKVVTTEDLKQAASILFEHFIQAQEHKVSLALRKFANDIA